MGPAGEMVSLHEEQVKILFQLYKIDWMLKASFLPTGGDRAAPGAAEQCRAWLCLRPHWGAEGRPSVQVTSRPPPTSPDTSRPCELPPNQLVTNASPPSCLEHNYKNE